MIPWEEPRMEGGMTETPSTGQTHKGLVQRLNDGGVQGIPIFTVDATKYIVKGSEIVLSWPRIAVFLFLAERRSGYDHAQPNFRKGLDDHAPHEPGMAPHNGIHQILDQKGQGCQPDMGSRRGLRQDAPKGLLLQGRVRRHHRQGSF